MTGYVVGNLTTSLIAGVVVFVDLAALGLPFPLLWALWVAIVDFLPMIGGALAGIPTVLFALAHSLTAGLVTAAVFVAYQQLENHVLNPLIMSRTVKVSPLLVLMSVLLGTSLGDWAGGVFGGFVAALISIPCAAALQVIVREIWRNTALPTARVRKPPGQEAAGSSAVSAVVEQDLLQVTGQIAAPGHGRRRGQRAPVQAHPDHVAGVRRPLPRPSGRARSPAACSGPVSTAVSRSAVAANASATGSEWRSGGSVNSNPGRPTAAPPARRHTCPG